MTTKNVEALERVMTHIRDRPETWYQGTYFRDWQKHDCGTTACFAGWTAQLFAREYGYRPYVNVAEGYDGLRYYTKDGIDGPIQVGTVAGNILGLDADFEAGPLFYGDNTMEHLEIMVKNLANDENIMTGIKR